MGETGLGSRDLRISPLLDFFAGGFIKSEIRRRKNQDLRDMRDRIREAVQKKKTPNSSQMRSAMQHTDLRLAEILMDRKWKLLIKDYCSEFLISIRNNIACFVKLHIYSSLSHLFEIQPISWQQIETFGTPCISSPVQAVSVCTKGGRLLGMKTLLLIFGKKLDKQVRFCFPIVFIGDQLANDACHEWDAHFDIMQCDSMPSPDWPQRNDVKEMTAIDVTID